MKGGMSYIESIYSVVNKILRIVEKKTDKHYGFYQLCPKCDGEKFIAVPHVHHGKVDVVCSICKGEGVIPRPEIKNMQP